MTEKGFKRKLTAILSADAVGYSRLMRDDEEATIRAITEYRNIITEQVKKHQGRVVDSPGDNVLAEFASVVDALKCAVQTQKEIAEQNVNLPEDRKMEFRIGINLGDVVEEGDRIYGDGVNVAARIESLADPGGISISRTAYDQVRRKLSLGYEYLGEHSVKNIDEPVRVYRVLTDSEHSGIVIGEKIAAGKKWRRLAYAAVACLIVIAGGLTIWNIYLQKSKRVDPADVDKMAYPLPDKPSIAVLPFDNMSGDPKQEYFSDGLTEEIITALSKTPKMLVIARNSTFTYKGKPVKIKQVAEELGVRYVLEGSVRKAGDQIRITAQLIDALKGNHLWAERYDRNLKDIFAVQDNITLEILRNLEVKLSRGEAARFVFKGTSNLEAYLEVLKAGHFVNQFNKESNIQARQHAEEAIRLDPQYPGAYNTLAGVTFMDVWLQISKSPKDSLMKAIELYKKALSLDNSYAPARAFLGWLYILIRQHEKGIVEAQRAVEMAPSYADAYSLMAQVLNYSGMPEEAIAYNEKAFRLNPVGAPSYYYVHAAVTYLLTAQYEDGVKISKEGLSRYPNHALLHARLAMLYAALGRNEEARDSVQDVLRIDPKFSAQRYAKTMPFKDPALNVQSLELMRKAGFPE